MKLRDDIKDLLPLIKKLSKKASFILEIGCAFGDGSMQAFSEVLSKSKKKDKLYISVDLEDNLLEDMVPEFPYWHLVLGDSREESTKKNVKKICGDRKADIIFIDTEHNYEIMEKELPNWEELSHESTIWLFHDTWMMGSYNRMTDAIKSFAAKHNWVYIDISKENNGLGAMVKNLEVLENE